jgi:hypothetical protein
MSAVRPIHLRTHSVTIFRVLIVPPSVVGHAQAPHEDVDSEDCPGNVLQVVAFDRGGFELGFSGVRVLQLIRGLGCFPGIFRLR